ncbi:SAG-related sequence [Besnoitia besnoiti]|uniref:SAG-related sequence n=1 Tax=Besnoitia besnoiti TaxID=94643 RepID=A0A2A9M0F3_BESBE|nr:SAG-related sequence [Besnoitia besnoiti]PFH31455.1 SAG-related sequence [Besnoitia besnoiti]
MGLGYAAHPRGGFSSTRRLAAVLICGIVLLGSIESAAEPTQRLVRPHSLVQEDTGKTESTASCSLQEDNNEPSPKKLTMSEISLSATLNCVGDTNQVIPSEKETVCSSDASLEDCKASSSNKLVKLDDLLEPGAAKASISPIESSANKGQKWTMTLERAKLPLTDKHFLVGCAKSEEDKKLKVGVTGDWKCKLPITVKAKSSSVDDNVVTCAYGEDSNKAEPLKVEVSPATNKMVLDCGKAGSLHPEGLTTFCEPGSETLEKCVTKGFEEILPTFVKDWWVPNEGKTSSTLTIPSSGFPSADQKFLVGCVLNETSQLPQEPGGVQRDKLEPSGNKTSSCKVLVTVKAAGASSIVSSNLRGLIVVSGFFGLLGFIADYF